MKNKAFRKRLKKCLRLLEEVGESSPGSTPEDVAKRERQSRKMLDRQLYMLFVEGIEHLSDKHIVDIGAKLLLTKEMDYPRHKIYLRVTSRAEYLRLHSCQKEPFTIEWIENFLKPGDIMYDIGANVGAYSLVASKFTEGKAKVFAFEPGFSTFPELCYNIILNNCQDSIIPLPVALSHKTEVAKFYYSDLTPGKALHLLGEWRASEKYSSPVYQQLMLSHRMDDLIKEFGLPIPNHIKIDVDGTEMNVLHGASETISDRRVISLMVESNEIDVEKMVEFNKQKGFDLSLKFSEGEGSNRPLYLLFTRNATKR